MEEPVYDLTLKGFLCAYVTEEEADRICDKLALRQLEACDKHEFPAIIYEDNHWVFRSVERWEDEGK